MKFSPEMKECFILGHRLDNTEYFSDINGIDKLENCPRLKTEVTPTAFGNETVAPTLNSMRATVMTHKVKGHSFQKL